MAKFILALNDVISKLITHIVLKAKRVTLNGVHFGRHYDISLYYKDPPRVITILVSFAFVSLYMCYQCCFVYKGTFDLRETTLTFTTRFLFTKKATGSADLSEKRNNKISKV